MKICHSCKMTKGSSEFTWINYLGPQKNGLSRVTSLCNFCRAKQKLATYRTPEGKLRYIYKHQVKNSIQRGHSVPQYTEQELIKTYIKDQKYILLYKNWVASGYASLLGPSLDRKDESKGYSFDNIELMTWQENSEKEYKLHREGNSINTDLKPVWQYSLKGQFIEYYMSQNEAARNVEGVTQQTISKCCLGEIQRAGRFRWFFEEQYNLAPIETSKDYSLIYEYSPITKELINIYTNIKDVTNSINAQSSIRRSIRRNTLYKERLFSDVALSQEGLTSFINNLKGSSPISHYDADYNFLRYYESANKAKQALGISDSTIKRYATSREVYENTHVFRLKFDDEIATRHRYTLIGATHLNILED